MRIVVACTLTLILTSVAHGGWFGYDNYEDCLLGRMKGQNQIMYETAVEACRKQFGVVFYITTSDVKWQFADGGISITSASSGSDKLEITNAQFSFSEKPCSDALTEADFGKPVDLSFIAGNARLGFDTTKMQCARALSFKGKYE